MCLRDEPEKGAVAIEAPRAALFDHFEAWLVVAVKDLFGYAAGGRAVNECEGIGTVPLRTHDGDHAIRKDAPDGGVRFEIFEFQMATPLLQLKG
jgi:hypothetical protein